MYSRLNTLPHTLFHVASLLDGPSYGILTSVPYTTHDPVYPFKQLKWPFEKIYSVISLSSLKPACVVLLELSKVVVLGFFVFFVFVLSRHYRIWLLPLFATSHVTFRTLKSLLFLIHTKHSPNSWPRYLQIPPLETPSGNVSHSLPPFTQVSAQTFSQHPRIAPSIIPTPFLFYFSP